MYEASIADTEQFWGAMAEGLHWQAPFCKVGPAYNFNISKGPVKIEWFKGGRSPLGWAKNDFAIPTFYVTDYGALASTR